MADDQISAQPDDGLVAMRAQNTWANPLANSTNPDGIVRPGDVIRVDPFYAGDLKLACLAVPVSEEDLDAAIAKAGTRPDPQGSGIRITKTKG